MDEKKISLQFETLSEPRADISYEVRITEYWDSSHQLNLPYESKCNRRHGHRYQIDVVITCEILNDVGMAVDFTHVKKLLRDYDHQDLNDYFVPSTAENIAAHLLEYLQEKVHEQNITGKVTEVRVSESPTTVAIARWKDSTFRYAGA